MASLKKVGYVSDIEGNYDYWRKYVEYSDVLVVEGSNVLLRDNCHFVCGGDVCDRGAGDVRVLRELLALKKLYPQRVHFVLGNRDINKLRLPAALHPSVLSQTPDVYWFDNSSQPGGNDYSLDNRANRLKWILLFTMGSPLSFECRRKELEILGLPSDDDSVADSYLKLIMPGGELFEYIRLGCMAVLIEDTLYVHGGLPDDFVGFVPPTRGGISQYYTDVHEWVREVNKFARSELDDFQNNIDSFLNSLSSLDNAAVKIWDSESGYGHAQPGSRLIQCGMGSSGRDNGKNPTVIYTSYLLNGSPVWPSDRATEWLARGGVTKLVVGHQPMGDSPLILTSPGGLNVISADTCYSKGVQYLVSDLSRSISLPSPPVSSSVSSLPESKSSPSSTTEEKWTTYHSFATEHGVIPRDTSDPWIAVDTRASRCISEICIVLDDEDGPFHVCTDERHDFDATPKRTRVSVKGVLSEGSPYQFTYPEEAGADALVGKKTVDNWIVKARGIHFPSSETTSPEYVQLGMSRSRDFKAKVIPLTEVLKMPLVNSWEEPPK